MSFDQLKKELETLTRVIEDQEKVAVPLFSAKLAQASKEYPEDQCIGVMSDVIARMMNSNKLFITRAEIKDLYRRLHSRNTKFASIFQEELGTKEAEKETIKYDRTGEDESLSLFQKAFEQTVDPVLVDGLNAAFGNATDKKASIVGKEVEEICSTVVHTYGLTPKTANFIHNNGKIALCRLSFDTPKGITSIFVPVELFNKKATMPSLFIGNAGPEDLNKDNLTNYISKNAGAKLAIEEQDVIQVLSKLVEDDEDTFSTVDLAFTKLNAAKENKNGEIFTQQVLGQAIKDNEVQDLSLPSYEDEEINSFAKTFDSVKGLVNFKFGKDKVNLGKSVILRNLNDLGLYGAQIAVDSYDDTKVVYAVNVNTLAFKVPVKIDNKVHVPTILICNGEVDSFDKDGITRLTTSNTFDHRASAAASPLYDLTANDLVSTVEQGVNEYNFKKAEDALNILLQRGQSKLPDALTAQEAYKHAFNVYMSGLSGSPTEKRSHCTMIVRNANSTQPVCGHTNLPLHKVYQDKNGDCRPLHRQGHEEASEATMSLSHKVLL